MSNPSSTERSRIDKAIAHILNHWKKGETLKEIAALYDVDPGNLDRAFRVRHGQTFKQFQHAKRKAYVEKRISEDRVLAFEIADELGFSSPQAFARWVRSEFGKSFGELRKHL